MKVSNKKEPIILLLGDIIALYASLWLMLVVRYGRFPGEELFMLHAEPFSILFIVWLFVFFIAGLYEKQTLVLKSKLPAIILNTQLFNSIVAVLFFYLIPYFDITPKTNLFIYLIVSFLLILLWRNASLNILGIRKRFRALLIARGEEMEELFREVNQNSRYHLHFISTIDLTNMNPKEFHKEVINRVYALDINLIVLDVYDEKVQEVLPELFNLIFSQVRFLDMHRVYEEIFDRVPLSVISYNWFLENLTLFPKGLYDILKRGMDITISFVLGVLTLPFYPFIALAIKLEDGGDVFIKQGRLGKGNRVVTIYKFRTMTGNDVGKGTLKSKHTVTKVGAFLRKTRLDELPQLWNVFVGDLSLIGPRPELPALVRFYESEVPYYNVRHLIKPGLSGWAQMYHENHPHHGADTTETKKKLSYDLYYIKNRSLFTDIKITLKTIKTLLSRSGR